jgi:hypothetical protein
MFGRIKDVDERMILMAMRYALDRKTAAFDLVVREITLNIKQFSNSAVVMIKQQAEEWPLTESSIAHGDSCIRLVEFCEKEMKERSENENGS